MVLVYQEHPSSLQQLHDFVIYLIIGDANIYYYVVAPIARAYYYIRLQQVHAYVDLVILAKYLKEKDLINIVEKFDGCRLKDFASNTVFSDGVQNAKILLIGEAPGATEDEQGIPFCGESGFLLDKMLETIGLSRKQNIYITNTIFWRPPANRRPTPEEIETCKPFVEKHIALLNPELIILIGGTATASLLGKKENISDIRKNYYSYTNQYLEKPILTTALFHPAFLLRQPSKKKDTWFDLLKIRDHLQEKGIL